jgi:hypothetical protein
VKAPLGEECGLMTFEDDELYYLLLPAKMHAFQDYFGH